MIYRWEELEADKSHLLLGNGFSIGISKNFDYLELIQVFNNTTIGRYGCTREIFRKLETSNFEDVLKAIYHALIVSIDNENALKTLYSDVKSALITAVQAIHPYYEKVPIKSISEELVKYKSVFTTNYDLILYWVILSELKERSFDFFRGTNTPFVQNNTEVFYGKLPIYYLHGAIHLKKNTLGHVFKTSVNLRRVEDFYEYIEFGEFPLFITEGHSSLKIRNIDENNYLRFCFGKFGDLCGTLNIYGHSLNEEYDGHIIEAIKGSKLDAVLISIYSKYSQVKKNYHISRMEKSFEGSNKKLFFYESDSHPFGKLVWP